MKNIPRVKICGITSCDDALAAIAFGADALGFLVGLQYRTDDELTPSHAAKIASSLPPFINTVLVTHRKELPEVVKLCQLVPVQVLQLHGDFPVKDVPELRNKFPYMKILKAVHVEDNRSIDLAQKVAGKVDGIVLDTKTETRIGGTGITHDWSVSRRIRSALADTPVILAGGLNPENVSNAIKQVEPYGVDVNTGVCAHPGKKSPELLEKFIRAAKRSLLSPDPLR